MVIDEKFYMRIGELIFNERRKQDILQIELAKKAGITRVSISNLEQGKQRMPIENIKKVLNVLKIDIEINLVKEM